MKKKILFNFILLILFNNQLVGNQENLMNFDSKHSEKSKTVAVVGAGLAGLTAAYRLQQNGFDVTVYEARNRPGGRVYTCFFENGCHEELGGQSINDGGDALNLRSLINEMNLEIETQIVPLDWLYLDDEDVAKSYLLVFQSAPKPTDELYHLLQEKSVTASNFSLILDELCDDNVLLRKFCELRTKAYEGLPSSKISPLYFESFWEFYKRIYQASHAVTKEDLIYPLYTVKGGMCTLIDALCSSLKKAINYNQALKKISKNALGKTILTFNDTVVEPDFVVLALPCSTLKDVAIDDGIIPSDQHHIINKLQYGSNAKVIIPIDESEKRFLILGNYATTITSLKKSIIWCYFGGNEGVFDSSSTQEMEKIIEKEINQLKKFFPEDTFNGAIQPVVRLPLSHTFSKTAVGLSWIKEEFSKGSYTSVSPEQFHQYNERLFIDTEEIRKVFRPIKNEIFFAGEHTSLENPSTMEGAVESGEKVARMILKVSNAL